MWYKQFSIVHFLKELFLETCHLLLDTVKTEAKFGFWLQEIALQNFIYFTIHIKAQFCSLMAQIPLRNFFLVSLKNIKAIKVKMDKNISIIFTGLFQAIYSQDSVVAAPSCSQVIRISFLPSLLLSFPKYFKIRREADAPPHIYMFTYQEYCPSAIIF